MQTYISVVARWDCTFGSTIQDETKQGMEVKEKSVLKIGPFFHYDHHK